MRLKTRSSYARVVLLLLLLSLPLALLPANASATGVVEAAFQCTYPTFPAAPQMVSCSGSGSVSLSGQDNEGNPYNASCIGCNVTVTSSIVLSACLIVTSAGAEESFLTLTMGNVTVTRAVPSGKIVTSSGTLTMSLVAIRSGPAVVYAGGPAIPSTSPTGITLTWDDPNEGAASDEIAAGAGTWTPDNVTTCNPPVFNMGVTQTLAVTSVA